MIAKIKACVEDGTFDKRFVKMVDSLERPIRAFCWFAAGYFSYAVIKVLQR